MSKWVEGFMDQVVARNPGENVFHQAVHEVVESLVPVLEAHPEFLEARLLERMVEPERVIMFRVPWVNDKAEVQVNRGYRVQVNSALGPYKGGLRFHPSVNLGVLKFLGFEQVFKNALTTLPLGGGKGGSDFDPKGKSDQEVMRFCQSFMTELLPAYRGSNRRSCGRYWCGGSRNRFPVWPVQTNLPTNLSGVLTGKGGDWGGSLMRPEATGYGAVYFADEMLKTAYGEHSGQNVPGIGLGECRSVYGGEYESTRWSSNHPVRFDGFILDRDGINSDKVRWVKQLKNVRRGRIREYAEHFGCEYIEGQRPWGVDGAECAFPCATQNEVNLCRRETTLSNGVYLVCRGCQYADVSRPQLKHLSAAEDPLGPGKAANAGGVATSGLEMTQNAGHTAVAS